MKEQLEKLYEYLVNNRYSKDAAEVEKLLEEYSSNNGLSEFSKKKISAMCNHKYLGDLYIKEFADPYMWWNFLSEIKEELSE